MEATLRLILHAVAQESVNGRGRRRSAAAAAAALSGAEMLCVDTDSARAHDKCDLRPNYQNDLEMLVENIWLIGKWLHLL